MGIIDKFFKKKITATAKKIAYNAMARANVTKSLYNMGGAGSGGQSGSHWPGALDSATGGWNNYISNYETRRRSRSAYIDQPFYKAMITRQADTIIDRGLMLEAVPDAQMLGLSDDQMMEWKSNVERGFHRWAASKQSSRNGLTNFYQIQRLAFLGQMRDGEYFPRFYYNNKKSLQNPLQLGLISPDMIQGYAITSTLGYDYSNGDGIDRNAQGEEIAYNIQVNENGQYVPKRIPSRGAKSGKIFMTHGFRPHFDDQTRGYPEMIEALQWVQKITDLSDAQLQKEIINASIALWVKPSDKEDADNPLDGLNLDSGAGFNDFSDVNTKADGETASTDDPADDLCYTDRSDVTFNKPGIGVFNLKSGQELKTLDYNRKNTEFNVFVDMLMEYLSAASGMPLEVMKMKFGENYSASRASLALFWRVAEQWRMELATDFLNHVYEAWLSGEIASGRVSAPGWSDPRIKASWLQCNWIGSPMIDIDPSKQADAIGKYIDMGLSNREREARKLNGTSFIDNVKRLSKENPALQAVRIGDANGTESEPGDNKKEEDQED